MEEWIIKNLATSLNLKEQQINEVLTMLEELYLLLLDIEKKELEI